MSTSDKPVVRELTVEVRSVAETQGRDGPQWEVRYTVPWSKYPAKSWLDRAPEIAKPEPGHYTALLERGRLLDNKDGKPHDGSQDWMYRWNLRQLKPPAQLPNGAAEQPAPTRDDQQYADRDARREWSIHRQVALKAAVEWSQGRDASVPDVLETAAIFHQWLEQLSDAPQDADQPIEASTPQPEALAGKQKAEAASPKPKPMTLDDFKVAVLSLQLPDDEIRSRLEGQAVAALRAAGESYEQIYARIKRGGA